MTRSIFAMAILGVLLAAALSRAATASAQAPTPTVTAAPGQLVAHVINDLNGDGVRQANEPGLAGWQLSQGCSDAILPMTTDATGTALGGNFDNCVRLERRFGWLPTSPETPSVVLPNGVDEVTFLVHDLGPGAMEISGEAIVAGLPAQSMTIDLAAPFAACEGSFLEPATWESRATIIVQGAGAKAGCPAQGATFTVLADGVSATTATFGAGNSKQVEIVVGGDSMRMYGTFITGATIGGVACGVVVPPPEGAFVPEGYVRVFVLSEEARAGCGTAGKQVRFYIDGRAAEPLVPWVAGPLDTSPTFTVADATPTVGPSASPTPQGVIVAPNTGSGGRSGGSGWAVALALGAAGSTVLAGGVVSRLRRRVD